MASLTLLNGVRYSQDSKQQSTEVTGAYVKRGTIALTGTDANKLVTDFALDVSEVVALFIVSDQNVLLEINNATTPAYTIALKRNEPLQWVKNTGGNYFSNPFTADVTALYATNQSSPAAAATVEFFILHN